MVDSSSLSSFKEDLFDTINILDILLWREMSSNETGFSKKLSLYCKINYLNKKFEFVYFVVVLFSERNRI